MLQTKKIAQKKKKDVVDEINKLPDAPFVDGEFVPNKQDVTVTGITKAVEVERNTYNGPHGKGWEYTGLVEDDDGTFYFYAKQGAGSDPAFPNIDFEVTDNPKTVT